MKKILTLFTIKMSFFASLFFCVFAANAQDGANDPTFLPGSGINNSTSGILPLSDGKSILTGFFTTYNGIARGGIARINDDGSLDLTFNPGTGTNNGIGAVALQSDGKIIIGGGFNTYNGTARAGIARLNADGSLDATFNPSPGVQGTFFYKSVYSIAIQSDGKIIIVGSFTAYNGTAINRIARLNTDGSLDAAFNPGTGADGTTGSGNPIVYSVAMQYDGKIMIAGDFTTYNGVARAGIARLNTDGSLDPTFNPGTGLTYGYITTIIIQNNGKFMLSGPFSDYNGNAVVTLARVNADGSFDATFDQGTGPNSNVGAIAIQSDGKVIIGGDFTAYNGTFRSRIARLNSNGSLDATFNPAGGSGANGTVQNIAVQSDGKIIIGGLFTSYNGVARNRIARILSVFVLPLKFLSFTGNRSMGTNRLVWKTAVESDITKYEAERSTNGRHFEKIATEIPKNEFYQTYTYDDNISFSGKLFYRIKIIENDGHESYSNVVSFTGNSENGITISPNPAKTVIKISLPDKSLLNTEAVIINAKGSVVLKQIIQSADQQINVSHLTQGIYFVKFSNGAVERLIKE